MMSLPNNSKGQQFADFISLNRYYGWYVMGGMCIVDAGDGVPQRDGRLGTGFERPAR